MLFSKVLHHPAFRSVFRNDKKEDRGDDAKAIHFFTTCPESWGGSEELWSRTARQLASEGYWITATLAHLDLTHPEVMKLVESGVRLEKYRGIPVLRRYSMFRGRWERPLTIARLRATNPQLAVISQGENMDGDRQVDYCRQAAIPYVIVCQKAGEDLCPMDHGREKLKASFAAAKRIFFVSQHNRAVTEERLGKRLTNAEVIANPFKVDYHVKLPWPGKDQGRYRLACVARLWMRDKGQDLLLKVLAMEKWRNRELEVHFYGLGPNAVAMREMADLLGLDRVQFCGFSQDVTKIWRQHHALVLPSRHEGLPLALVEAMLCGRPAIVTNAGGNGEVLDDEESGFLAQAATVDAFDDAMERAWIRRHEWQKIGANAARLIRTKVPEDPSRLFTEKITAIYDEVARTREP